MNDFLNYTGKIEISDGESTSVIKNSGKIGVSELFTRAVLGYPTSNSRPSKLDILDREQGGTSILFQQVGVRSGTFEIISDEQSEYNGWKYPVLDILISGDNINISDYSEGKDCYITLYNSVNQEFAKVKIKFMEPTDSDSEEGTFYYHSGNNILIRWYMYITNRNEG